MSFVVYIQRMPDLVSSSSELCCCIRRVNHVCVIVHLIGIIALYGCLMHELNGSFVWSDQARLVTC